MAENISREVRLYMGKQLKEARERKGFTKEELAGLLCISPYLLENLECGVKGIDIPMLLKMVKVLSVTPNDILPEGEQEKVEEGLVEEIFVCIGSQDTEEGNLVFTVELPGCFGPKTYVFEYGEYEIDWGEEELLEEILKEEILLLLEPDFEESELAGADWKFYFNQE